MAVKLPFIRQKMMRTVLVALVPVALMSVYLYGWRHIWLASVVTVVACLSEYLVMRSIQKEKTKISEAVLVSSALFTLTLPPATPVWIAVVGILFAVVFGKCVFGGFGRNIFNPALVGRCFVYIAFPGHLAVSWTEPFTGFPGGFLRWFPAQADAVSVATPLRVANAGGPAVSLLRLTLGTVSGSLGETSAILILLAAAYLLWRKTASYQVMVSTLASGVLLSAVLYYAGVGFTPPLTALLSGGFLFGGVFMATDPVTAPRLKAAQWMYGALIGVVTMVIRQFSLFGEGMMFAVLIANAFVPLMELQIKRARARSHARSREAAT